MSKDLRTIDVKSTPGTIVKPGELVDVVEVTALTLTDRKIYNLLVENAWNRIADPITHCIPKETLKVSNRANERLDGSIMRLMGAIAHIKTKQNGESAIMRVQLLGKNIEHNRKDGNFYYTFDPDLREALKDSTIFAKLKKNVMLSFKGKYGLALYEMIEKRINMNKSEEVFPMAEFRKLLGVPKGKLATWYNFRTRALEAAAQEVNQLSPTFRVEAEGFAERSGGTITHIRLKWWPTSPDGQDDAVRELTYSGLGRAARRNGTAEDLVTYEHQSRLSHSLTDQSIETARKILLNNGYRGGVQEAIILWEEVFQNKVTPENPSGAFVAFCKKLEP